MSPLPLKADLCSALADVRFGAKSGRFAAAISQKIRGSIGELRKAAQASGTLHRLLLKYVQSFMVQTAYTAIANAHANLPERLARWLLMAPDRVGGDTLALTHEFIGLMLGVRRAGVTEALHSLQQKGLIQSKRGQIAVLKRAGLERVAGDFYGLPEHESAN